MKRKTRKAAKSAPTVEIVKRPKFQKGDWVFCYFSLHIIKETKEDRITSVSDGFIEMGSRDLSDLCFPLEMKVKQISDNFQAARERLHREGLRSLNFPDIMRWMEQKWASACRLRANDKDVDEILGDLDNFVRKILGKCQEVKIETIEGIYLIRQ